MGKSLVIVESPAKAKTINKYLGKDFIVKSSVGHVRDLPTKALGQVEPKKTAKELKDYSDKKKRYEKKLLASLALQSAVCTRLIARVGFIPLILMPYHSWPGDRQSLSVASWFCRVLTGSKKQRSSFCGALPAHST